MDRKLLIFIRNPELGQVKTRLSRTVGDTEALRIYRILLEKTRQAAQKVNSERWLLYSDRVDENDDWSSENFVKMVQQPGDLGARMQQAFQSAFAAGAGRVVIIGSDCPGLTTEILEEAFQSLNANDCVLGPVTDGGYYLLGMQELDPRLFQDIAWSTETVRSVTLERMASAGKSCFLLPMLADVDNEQDWIDWLAKEN